jgi:hypothetical protein
VSKLHTGALADYGMLCEEELDWRLEDSHRYHESGGRETIDVGVVNLPEGTYASPTSLASSQVGVVVGAMTPGGEVTVDLNAPQPAPLPSVRTPTWELVIAYARARYTDCSWLKFVLADMHVRDYQGRAKYGVPLASDNGRDHLIDAYQEIMDFAVYLASELNRRDVPLSLEFGDLARERGEVFDPNEGDLLDLFHEAVASVVSLRRIITERDGAKP